MLYNTAGRRYWDRGEALQTTAVGDKLVRMSGRESAAGSVQNDSDMEILPPHVLVLELVRVAFFFFILRQIGKNVKIKLKPHICLDLFGLYTCTD